MYDLCKDEAELEQLAKEGGWENLAEFEKFFGVDREDLIGKKFEIVHDRLYIEP